MIISYRGTLSPLAGVVRLRSNASRACCMSARTFSTTTTTPTPTTPTTPAVTASPLQGSILINPGIHPKILAKYSVPRTRLKRITLGAVAYCEAISSIWKGMMRHFARQGLDVDFVLFTSYERQIEELLKRNINIAWNGPLAHARLVRLANQKQLGTVYPLGMRDVDRDFLTHIIVRKDAGIRTIKDLDGRRIAAGTIDSPQAYIMPFHALQKWGVQLNTLTVSRFDRDIGKHGDTAHGEDAVCDALLNGSCEAGFISDLMWKRYVKDGKIPTATGGGGGGLSLLLEPLASIPNPITFDHCQFDSYCRTDKDVYDAVKFHEALLKMDGSGHAEDKKTMELEGISTSWLPHRSGKMKFGTEKTYKIDELLDPTVGYKNMFDALDVFKEPNVSYPGVLHTPKRHPFKHLMVDSRIVLDSFGC